MSTIVIVQFKFDGNFIALPGVRVSFTNYLTNGKWKLITQAHFRILVAKC